MAKPVDHQVILITGATDGIGRGTAMALASRGATLLLHGRDAVKLAAARTAIAEQTGNERLYTYVADFASLADVWRLGREVSRDHQKLDVLINNAGVGSKSPGVTGRELTADGYELRYQVNHLAAFLLQVLLLPLLRAAAPARIVNVASGAQAEVDFDNIMLAEGYDGFRAYSQSKLAMVMATLAMAEHLEPAVVTVNALHPGTLLDTKMVRQGFGAPRGPVEIGIKAVSHLATAPELDGVSGQYFNQTRPMRAHPQAYDKAACKRLWSHTENLIAARLPQYRGISILPAEGRVGISFDL